VTLSGCRTTGLAGNDGLLSDVAFVDCKVDLTKRTYLDQSILSQAVVTVRVA